MKYHAMHGRPTLHNSVYYNTSGFGPVIQPVKSDAYGAITLQFIIWITNIYVLYIKIFLTIFYIK